MKREESKLLKEKAERSPLWVLEMRVSKQNKLLLELAGQGIGTKDCKWRNLIGKRNIYRNVLINKLKKWKKGEEQSNPRYSDYINTVKYKSEQEAEALEKND